MLPNEVDCDWFLTPTLSDPPETDPSKISVGKGSVTMRISSGTVEPQDTDTSPNLLAQQSCSKDLLLFIQSWSFPLCPPLVNFAASDSSLGSILPLHS